MATGADVVSLGIWLGLLDSTIRLPSKPPLWALVVFAALLVVSLSSICAVD
jgi:hypothetical protein